jgi:hypothetical protein
MDILVRLSTWTLPILDAIKKPNQLPEPTSGAVKLGAPKLLINVSFGVRRTISNSTWSEIRTAYASGIGLREIAQLRPSRSRRFTAFESRRRTE